MREKVFFFSSMARMAGILGYPEGFEKSGKYPAIVINHGYSGNKEEYDEMAEALNKSGFVTLQFDSRGCGESEAVRGRMMCSTEWVEDVYNAVSYLTCHEFVDKVRVGLTGCSMGGAVTVYAAANDPRVKCAFAMAPLCDGEKMLREAWCERRGPEGWNRFLSDMGEDDRLLAVSGKSRFVTVPYGLCMVARDEYDFMKSRAEDPRLVRDVPLESVRNSFLQFKPLEHCWKIRIPIMFIHGDADYIVPKEHSIMMYEKIDAKKELVILRGAPHPLPVSEYRHEVFAHAVRWFKENLKKSY